MNLHKAELMVEFSAAGNKSRFDFLRCILDLMPDEELQRVPELAKKAKRRRIRQKISNENMTKKPRHSGHNQGEVVPEPDFPAPEPAKDYKGTKDPNKQGWFRKYKKSEIISIDVEKVEMYRTGLPVVKNAKGKEKQYDQKAGSIGITDFEGNKLYHQKVFRPEGSFRENPNAKNGFKTNSLNGKDTKTIDIVLMEIRQILEGKLIIGCALANDFESMDLIFGEYSENCFDLQWHYFDESISKYGKTITERWPLKKMCSELLHKTVQETGQVHSALQDAADAMQVFREVYTKLIPEPQERVAQK